MFWELPIQFPCWDEWRRAARFQINPCGNSITKTSYLGRGPSVGWVGWFHRISFFRLPPTVLSRAQCVRCLSVWLGQRRTHMTVEPKASDLDASRLGSIAQTPAVNVRMQARPAVSSPTFPLRSTFELAGHHSSGHSLEDLVRELLLPLLKQWLDQNLPQLVERRVNAEIERIANLSRSAAS